MLCFVLQKLFEKYYGEFISQGATVGKHACFGVILNYSPGLANIMILQLPYNFVI